VKLSKTASSTFAGKRAGAATDTSAVTEVCLARQPIFATTGEVVGYELLYRRASTDTTTADRRNMAEGVIVQTFIDIGLGQLTSGRPAFMNFTREMLLGRAFALMPPESVVIELLENVEPDEQVEQACEELVDAGYSLALDDFVWSPRYRRLLELAAIVKIDVLNQPAAALDEIAQRLAPYDVRLLAERVETAEVRAVCAGLGYEMFQGYYYARPEMIVKRALTSDEIAIAQAMTVMRDPRATDSEAEAVLGADVGLSDKLLRMINSAARGGRGIESITHAVQLSGRNELSKWLALLLVSSMAARGGSNRELVHLAVQRARMCELLGASTGRDRDSGAVFLVGLFSVLDAISRMPMPEMVQAVQLAPPLRDALVSRTGPYATALKLTEAYEKGEWTRVARDARSLGLDLAQVCALYVQSLTWTRERLRSLAGA
jgi:EAL and modified HD-GYP domain-containing signal transduction protein